MNLVADIATQHALQPKGGSRALAPRLREDIIGIG